MRSAAPVPRPSSTLVLARKGGDRQVEVLLLLLALDARGQPVDSASHARLLAAWQRDVHTLPRGSAGAALAALCCAVSRSALALARRLAAADNALDHRAGIAQAFRGGLWRG